MPLLEDLNVKYWDSPAREKPAISERFEFSLNRRSFIGDFPLLYCRRMIISVSRIHGFDSRSPGEDEEWIFYCCSKTRIGGILKEDPDTNFASVMDNSSGNRLCNLIFGNSLDFLPLIAPAIPSYGLSVFDLSCKESSNNKWDLEPAFSRRQWMEYNLWRDLKLE